MRIIRNYFYTFIFQIFLILVPTLTLPYVTRVLGPEKLGINTYTYSITYYFTLLAVLGISTYAQREIAYVRNDKKKLQEIFWEIELVSIMTTLFSYFLMVLFILFSSKYSHFLWIYSLMVLANIFDISWLIIGLEKFSILVLRNFAVKISSLILIFAFVKSANDLGIYVLINAGSVLVSNILLLPYIKEIGLPKHFKNLRLRRHLKGMIILFIPQVSISLYTVLSKVTLGAMGYIEDASFFDSADKIIRLIFTVLASLSTVLMPLISNEISKENLANVKKIIRVSLLFSLFVSIGMFVGLFAVSNTFIPLFLGNNFQPVSLMLQCQALILVPMSIANVIGNQYLIPNRKEKILTVSILFGSVVSIVINVPFIHYFGPFGASISIVISEVLVTIMQVVLSRGAVSYNGIWKESSKYLFAGFVMFCTIDFCGIYLNGWVFIILSGILGGAMYTLVCLILKVEIIAIFKNFIMNRKLTLS